MRNSFMVWQESPTRGWQLGAVTEGYDAARDRAVAQGLLQWASNYGERVGYVAQYCDFSQPQETPTGNTHWLVYTFTPGRGTDERVYDANADGRPRGYGT